MVATSSSCNARPAGPCGLCPYCPNTTYIIFTVGTTPLHLHDTLPICFVNYLYAVKHRYILPRCSIHSACVLHSLYLMYYQCHTCIGVVEAWTTVLGLTVVVQPDDWWWSANWSRIGHVDSVSWWLRVILPFSRWPLTTNMWRTMNHELAGKPS